MPVRTRQILRSELSDKFVRRFHSRYQKGGSNECWNWQRSKGHGGYGQTFLKGDTILAHRVAYLIANGSIPADRPIIRHTCDNPSCVNPSHLLCGTSKDNMDDMNARGRRARGEKSGGIRTLTTDNVMQIIRLYNAGTHSQALLAKMFNTSQPHISCIVNRKLWKHVSLQES